MDVMRLMRMEKLMIHQGDLKSIFVCLCRGGVEILGLDPGQGIVMGVSS